MKGLLPILRLIGNYKLLVALHMLSNILMAVFTLLTIPATIPLFTVLFGDEDKMLVAPEGPISISDVEAWSRYLIYSFMGSASSPEQSILYVSGILIALFFLKNLFSYLSLFFIAPVRTGVISDLRQMLYDKLMRLPLSYFSEERKGDLISRAMADAQEVEWSILTVLEKIVREPLLILGSIAWMLMISPRLTGFVFLLVLLTVGVIGGISNKLKKQSRAVQSTLGELMSTLDESLFGMKVIKGFRAEPQMQKKFGEVNKSYSRLLTRLFWRKDLASPLSEFLGIAVVCVLLWFGSRLVFQGNFESEVFLTFLIAFFYIINPAKSFTGAYYNIQKGLAGVERIEQVLQSDERIFSPVNPVELGEFQDKIQYRDVSFYYDGSEIPAILNVDLEIPKGKIVAFVGSSGAGKTTIADLLMRYYDVTSGNISIDGIDIRDMRISELRSLMGIVTQEPVLFNDTIRANIAFGKPDATEEEITKAAMIANAHDFILQTPNGYNTVIGDRGTKLSGGQRQRISIARAVLVNPPILILDEATSALDSESEKLVQEALQKIMVDRTSLVIAHRLSTIQNADKIVVMKDGEVIETGHHSELLSQDGEYKKFVEMQAF
jgi:subfamily B ATP-binding cassette protein MsbA